MEGIKGGDERVQTSSYKISPGDVMNNMLSIVINVVLHSGKLKTSHHRKKNFSYVR